MDLSVALIMLTAAALEFASAWLSYQTAKLAYRQMRQQQEPKRKFLRFW
jgi:hypothetical protein